MAMYGADTPELRSIAKEMRKVASDLERESTTLTRLLKSVDWYGPIQAAFVGSWASNTSPQLMKSSQYLRAEADRLVKNADEQDRASEASPGLGAGTGGSIGEPDPMNDHNDHSFLWFHWGKPEVEDFPNTPLFEGPKGDEISPGDVTQGRAGDCYFLATLSALAATPEGQAQLRKMIVDNGDGTSTVTFADGEKVTVDTKYYADNGSVMYAKVGDDQWVAAFEEAYAKKHGGYEDIGKGGHANKAMTELGYNGTQTSMSSMSKADLETTLKSGKPIVLDCALNNTNGGITSTYEGNHSYAVTGVTTDSNGNVTSVTVRNPWGSNSGLTFPPGVTYSPGDAEVTMTVEQAQAIFYGVNVAE